MFVTSPNQTVKIVECPRDAWQGLPRFIPSDHKAAYLRSLIAAGFTHIDAASFVSPAAVPQMADSDLVLSSLEIPSNVEIIGIVVNEKGAQRAIATGRVTTLGYPYSVSPNFLLRNQHQTPEESLAKLLAIHSIATRSNLGLVVYISMAFGNPYNDPWSIHQVADACSRLIDLGITQISLADTVGLASATLVTDLVTPVSTLNPQVEIGVHLHAKPDGAADLVRAAYAAHCRRFDSAMGGLGGCPFAQQDLVGNLPTEILIQTLTELGAHLPQFKPLDTLIAENTTIAQTFATI